MGSMGYCKGIQSEHFHLHVFLFLEKVYFFVGIYFRGRYEKLFLRQFYLVDLPLFPQKGENFSSFPIFSIN